MVLMITTQIHTTWTIIIRALLWLLLQLSSLTLRSASLCSLSICKTTTCPAVPATTNISLTGHRNILCIPSLGSSVYGSKCPILRKGGQSSSSSAGGIIMRELNGIFFGMISNYSSLGGIVCGLGKWLLNTLIFYSVKKSCFTPWLLDISRLQKY